MARRTCCEASRQGVRVLRAARAVGELTELTPAEVYRVDAEGVRSANVCSLARRAEHRRRTACEIGMFAELGNATGGGTTASSPRHRPAPRAPERQRGRRRYEPLRRRAIEACGRICWSVDEAVEALRELESQSR